MPRTYLKKWHLVFFICTMTACLFAAGCQFPPALTGDGNMISNAPGGIPDNSRAIGGYPVGKEAFNHDALVFGNSAKFSEMYADWKKNHVVSDGCPPGAYRIKADPFMFDDTRSEGIAYGMLIAVYFGDRDVFDKLYKYCQAHFIKTVSGRYTRYIPLMHWKVNRGGKNVSEFADYMIASFKDKYGVIGTYNPTIPHGPVYGNLKTGTIFILPENYSSNEKQRLDASADYYCMAPNNRGYSSATDADVDIAAALAFASKMWPDNSTGINYLQEARNMINAMERYDFTTSGFIKGGNAWGSEEGWNPCYVTPAYYKNIFAKVCPNSASFWNTVYDRMYQEMGFVRDKILQQSGRVDRIYYPDWCDTSYEGGTHVFRQSTTSSDRLGWSGAGPVSTGEHHNPPEDNDYTYVDAMWKLNTTKDQYTKTGLSFNSYYDACRVPWRIAADYAWGGDKAWQILYYINRSYADYQAFCNRKDGFSVTGGTWNWDHRDIWNKAQGGINPSEYGAPPTTFLYMAACSQMVEGYAVANNYWTVWNKSMLDNSIEYSYYPNQLNMLGLLFVTGKFKNLYDDKYANPYTPVPLRRYYSPSAMDHTYTIDFDEYGNGSQGYYLEGSICNVYKPGTLDATTVALYRLYKPSIKDHFFTIDWNEARNAQLYYGYQYEGVACNVYATQRSGTIPIYRFWHSGINDHLYSTNRYEVSSASGWVYEGIKFYVLP